MKLITLLVALAGAANAVSVSPRDRTNTVFHDRRGDSGNGDALQDIITWDKRSLFIRGERVMMFSGEVHPFRLPVPSLYIDIFQKIKALGFNMVSFYVDWALLEGKAGSFRAEDIFDLQPFFDAASEAGIYLLARPGPYINAEVSGGGFPGWLQRIKGILRTPDKDYLDSTNNYIKQVGAIIAKAQITNGGPVILYQPENEYSHGFGIEFPDQEYLKYVLDQARDAGIVVPLINNDARPSGIGAPGTGAGAADIYGYDAYPRGFDCEHPYEWPEGRLPTYFHETHEEQSPNTPHSIIEYQGGSFDPFGGWGFENCAILANQEFQRVFFKNNYAAGVTIFSIYMTFGGTNWGNLGHPGGYTSYDYGASIRENRRVDREQYSELKLQAQFMRVTPSYITTTAGNLTTGKYSDSKDVSITQLKRDASAKPNGGDFYIIRHTDYASQDSTSYKLTLPTESGDTLTIPQLGGSLSLHGRDSKIHVVDYPAGDYTIAYSTAEVFTWNTFSNKTVIVLYGGPDELHEFSVKTPSESKIKQLEGDSVKSKSLDDSTVTVQWKTDPKRQVVQILDLVVYLLDRNSAYNYWVPLLPGKSEDGPAFGTSIMNPESVIVNGGYLVRSVSIDGSTLALHADFNATSSLIEVIGAPSSVSKLTLNGNNVEYTTNDLGNWVYKPDVDLPAMELPDLSKLDWRVVDSLPEVQPNYDDSQWTIADHNTTNNPHKPLRTPVSLYGSDYGFHAGTLLYRGYFTAGGEESKLTLWTQGGSAYASSVWLNDTFLGSFNGLADAGDQNSTYTVPNLAEGKRYVLTVLVDNTGLEENFNIGLDDMKYPRGILRYELTSASGSSTSISPWKLTGNLGGEDYSDIFRGPLNEGGLFAERQGYHLPSPPIDDEAVFSPGSPYDGTDHAGVSFYAAPLKLNLPADKYDVPLSFVFKNATDAAPYRAMLYVNGFQYGKFVPTIGPQFEFPVPEGIINHNGDNWVGLAVWALDGHGAKVPDLQLKAAPPVLTGRKSIELVEAPAYSKRKGAY